MRTSDSTVGASASKLVLSDVPKRSADADICDSAAARNNCDRRSLCTPYLSIAADMLTMLTEYGMSESEYKVGPFDHPGSPATIIPAVTAQ